MLQIFFRKKIKRIFLKYSLGPVDPESFMQIGGVERIL